MRYGEWFLHLIYGNSVFVDVLLCNFLVKVIRMCDGNDKMILF